MSANIVQIGALCVCGHVSSEHDDAGCVACAQRGDYCPSYWTQTEMNDAVNAGLLEILKAQQARARETNHAQS